MARIETTAPQQHPPTSSTPANVNDTSKAPEISIREYRPEDHAHVVTLFKDGMMFYTDPAHAQHQVWVDYVAHSLQEDLADIQGHYMREGSNFFIATATIADSQDQEHQEVIVGTLGIEKSNTEGVAELRRVSVKAEYRRFGIGKLLMRHATQWAKDHKYGSSFSQTPRLSFWRTGSTSRSGTRSPRPRSSAKSPTLSSRTLKRRFKARGWV